MAPRPRNGLSLCAGGAGLDMGLGLAEPEFHTRAFVEWEKYPREVIIAAQRAGYLAPAPIWDDLTTFDARPLAGAIDTLLAGYPCQPFSQAGQRKGEDDERHLWPDVARVARELGDGLRWIFLENVPGHVTLGAETVLRELRDMGFTPAAGLFSAQEVGASHERLRWFCVAYRDSDQWRTNIREPNTSADGRHDTGRSGGNVAHGTSAGLSQRRQPRQPETGAQAGHRLVAEPKRCGENDVEKARCAERWAHDAAGYDYDRAKARRDQGVAVKPFDNSRPLFPPGPGDAISWADAIAVAPYLAPATSLSDCLSWAGDMAQIVEGPIQAKAQSDLCRMADGMATRSRALRLLGNGVCPLAAGYAWRTLSAAHGLGRVDLGAANEEQNTHTDEPFLRVAE